MVDFYFNVQCEEQFAAFKKGFLKTQNKNILDLLHPEELEELVCGSQELNFEELKETSFYEGYTEESPIIVWFWEILLDLSHENKIKFLQFSTGSDRSPIGGLGNLELKIAKHGPDTDRLPCSQTCFNYLLVPEYSSKEKLREKLMLAIQNNVGFGMY